MRKHLEERYFDLNQHTCWFNDEVAVFPIYGINGKIVGYQNYRPDGTKERNNNPLIGKYFSRLQKDIVSVWGMESFYFSNELYVCEGIFDAARFTYNGKSAVAILSCDVPKYVKKWFAFIRKIRPVIVVCDNDKSSEKMIPLGHVYYKVSDGDPNSCSELEFQNILKKFSGI
jgi:hypothetical protein